MTDAQLRGPTGRESRTILILILLGLLGLFGLMVLCGLPALHEILSEGASAPGQGSGLYGVAHAFFAGISAGAFFVATLPYVFATQRFAPLGRLSLFVAFVAHVAAVVAAAVGPEPTSGWAIMLNGVYFAVLAVMLFVTLRPALRPEATPVPQRVRDTRLLRGLGIAGLVVAVAFPGGLGATSTGLLPLSFILLSGTSGAAIVLGVALLMLRGGDAYRQAVCSLGRLVGVLLAVQAAVVIAEPILAARGVIPEHAELLRTVAFGRGGWLFWGVQIVAGSAVPLIVLFQKQPSLRSDHDHGGPAQPAIAAKRAQHVNVGSFDRSPIQDRDGRVERLDHVDALGTLHEKTSTRKYPVTFVRSLCGRVIAPPDGP